MLNHAVLFEYSLCRKDRWDILKVFHLIQIEHMVGIRGGNIFRSSLDLLQSTAALVRHSPGAEQTHPPFETQIPTQHKHLSPKPISPEHQNFVLKKPFDPTLSPTSLGGAPESPALTVSPPPLSLHSSQDRLQSDTSKSINTSSLVLTNLNLAT